MTEDGTPEARSAQEAAAGAQSSRIVPDFWVPVSPTLAWIAFGSAETNLDKFCYFGASIWYAADPLRIVEWLAEIKETGEFAYDSAYPELLELEGGVMSRAARTASYLTALADAKKKNAEETAKAEAAGNPKIAVRISLPGVNTVHVREAASELLEELETDLPEATSKQSALWNASETLRRDIAKGDIKAFGWRGHGPDFSDQHKPLPLRERIPDDLCAAPITITGRGLLSFARGDGGFGTYEVLWSNLIIDSEELLRVHPHVADDRPSVMYTPPLPEFRRDLGGKNADHDWRPFEQEGRQYLQLLTATPAGGDPQRMFRDHMRRWAKRNMDPKNDATRPARRTVDRKSNSLFPILMAEISQASGPNRT